MSNQNENDYKQITFQHPGMTVEWLKSTLAMIEAGETVVGLTDMWIDEFRPPTITKKHFIKIASYMITVIAEAMRRGVVRVGGHGWESNIGFGPTRQTRLGRCRVITMA